MRALTLLGVAAALAATALAGDELVWKSLFPPPYAGVPEITLSIACVSSNLCYIPGGNDGTGFGVFKFDGKTEGNIQMMGEPNMTLMILTVAAGGTDTNPHAAIGGVGLLSVSQALQYLQAGTTWLPSHIPFEFIWETASMTATDDGKHIIALGQSASVNSIMHSTDSGMSFTPITINIPPLEANCTAPVFASMVDGMTWFMVLGGEPAQPSSGSGSGSGNRHGSGSNSAGSNSGSNFAAVRKMQSASKMFRTAPTAAPGEPVCHYTGQIAMTTNAGQSWTVLFSSHEYSFSQIDCISATHCVAIGNGVNSAGAAISVVLATTDGTTWNETLRTVNSPINFNTVEFADAQEVWLGGGVDISQTEAAGAFFVSMDGGMTWQKNGALLPNILAVMDISFTTDGIGFAVALTVFKTSTILRYSKQSFSGYFTQANCIGAGCALCQNTTFQQGMCLPTGQTTSAVAKCTDSAIVMMNYNSSSCTGAFTQTSAPISKCLVAGGNSFENYCNTSALGVASRQASFVQL